MNIIVYSLTCYLITAVISFAVIGVVVLLAKFLSRNGAEDSASEAQ